MYKKYFPVWIELNLKQCIDVEETLYKYDLILDSSSMDIYLYHIRVKLAPQQYKFLKKVLEEGLIGPKTIMYKVKTQRLKGDKKYLSYRIKNKILNKIRKAFIFNRYPSLKISDLEDELTRKEPVPDKNRIKEIKNEIKKVYNDIYSKHKKDRSFQIFYREDCQWVNVDSNIEPIAYKEKQDLDIEDCLKKLISVKNGSYSTYFKKYDRKNI